MDWKVYLSGEIHTNWRETIKNVGNAIEIIDLYDIGTAGDPPIPGWNKNRIRNNYFGKNQFEDVENR